MSAPECPEPRRRSLFRRIIFKTLLYGFVLVLLVVGAAGIAVYIVYDNVMSQGVPGEIVRVEIPEGATGKDVAEILAGQGLVRREYYFRMALRAHEDPGIIRHGRYDLPRGLSANQLLNLLYEGPSQETLGEQVRVVIPEGLSIAQIAARLEDPEGFLVVARNPELLARLGVDADSLEGFLMPNTYFFDKPPTGPELVERMFATFEKSWQELAREIPEAAERDHLEVVTVASLVEEEARLDAERPLVAAVIYNRIQKGWTLDLDSTLQFATGKYGKRMLDADKAVESPYNTYTHAGLPPGPISSPGKESLRAALAPAHADYLFFVSNADGKSHTFSATLREHNEAVARFRREIRTQRAAEQ